MRSHNSPSAGTTIVGLLKEYEGGLRASTAEGAKTALNAVPTDSIDQPLGVLGLDQDGRVRASAIPAYAAPEVSVIGPLELFVGQSATYVISNYDMFTDYTVDIIAGSVVRNRQTITYYAPNTVMPAGFKVNGKSFTPTIKPPGPATPSITSPVDNAVSVATNYTLTSSAFAQIGDTSTHVSSDWQIATDANFITVVKSSINDAVNRVAWAVTGLNNNTSYFARVRYLASNGNYSSWSPTIAFTTSASVVMNLSVPSNVKNYNMKSAAIASGWDQVSPLKLTVTINNGVVVGSSTISAASFDTGTGFPVGTELSVVNNGHIVGKGGNGGTLGVAATGGGAGITKLAGAGQAGGAALRAQTTLAVTNNGTIGGGGGGGGGGQAKPTVAGGSGQAGIDGGAGGGGAGFDPGYSERAASGFPFAQDGNLATGGNGQSGGDTYASGPGGKGGNLGVAGSAGGSGIPDIYPPAQGGAAGPAVQGNINIAWLVAGTRLGYLT